MRPRRDVAYRVWADNKLAFTSAAVSAVESGGQPHFVPAEVRLDAAMGSADIVQEMGGEIAKALRRCVPPRGMV